MNSILRILVSLIALVWTSAAVAGDGPGTSAVNFLNIGVSARSSATGGAYSAISDGPFSAYYNPAGLARAENIQIAGMHSEWLGDLRYEYLGLATPIGRRGGLGVSFSYLSYGKIAGYSAANEPIGNIGAYDMSGTVSYGHAISKGLSLGLGVKTIGEKLDNVSVFGFAGDLGVQYKTGQFLTGISVMNIGPKLKYETASSPLPTTVNAGVSYMPFGENLAVMLGLAVPFAGNTSFRGGIEYSYQNMLILRTGYDSRDRYDSRSGISFGGGLNLSTHSLDYAYNINSMFGGTHQISFVFRFGKSRETLAADRVIIDPPRPAPVEVFTVEDQKQTQQIKESKTETKPPSRFYVCAARYSDQESASKHLNALKMFDVSARIIKVSDEEFLVVLKEAKSMKKAEKARTKYQKKGIKCFVEGI